VEPRRLISLLISILLVSIAWSNLGGSVDGQIPESAWVRLGGPLGGLGYDVRMRPDNPDTMYVTDAFAGVFVSTDGGANWVPSVEGITARSGETGDAIPIFSLTIDPNDHNILWAGTQNVRGIFKSVDGGQSWSERVEGIVERDGITFRGFTVDPTDSETVYAAAEISSWAWAGQERPGREFDRVQGVVYRTTDGGTHWDPIWRGDNLARYIWIDPRDTDVIYVSTGFFDREAANSVPSSRTPGGEGVVKSTDGGRSWSGANDGLENLYVGSLFMHPSNPDLLLAGTGNNQYYDHAGIYLSTDGGVSWHQVGAAGDVINSVEFARSDPAIAYAASNAAVYRSTDEGRTWTMASGGGAAGWGAPGVRAGFPVDLEVDPRDPNRLFANNYGGGNFLSVDGGRTWSVASTGYSGAQVRDVAVDPSDSASVYAAARSGLFSSADGGLHWDGMAREPVRLLEWNGIAVDPDDPDHLLALSNWDGVLAESADRGRTWVVRTHTREGEGFRSIAFAPGNPQVVYAGTGAFFSAGTFDDGRSASGVLASSDGGRSWSEANDDVSRNAQIADLAVDPRDERRVFAASTTEGLLLTVEGGSSWEQLADGLPPRGARAVALDPSSPDTVFVGFAGGGAFRSNDGGLSWQRLFIGPNPEGSISAIVIDPTNPNRVYAADVATGVSRSEDGGETWFAIDQGLAIRAVTSLAISMDGAHLYAGTEGGGVFRLDLGAPPAEPGGATASQTPRSETTAAATASTSTPDAGSATPAASDEGDDEGGIDPLPLFAAALALAAIILGGAVWLGRRGGTMRQ
jgi:photosystem II stability/assembly factor-like uncharacterized protein